LRSREKEKGSNIENRITNQYAEKEKGERKDDMGGVAGGEESPTLRLLL